MSLADRQRQFEQFITAQPGSHSDAKIARSFGYSNSSRVIEGGLFASTSNLEAYSEGIESARIPRVSQFVLLSVLTFPPEDEVYFAITVTTEAARVNDGLIKLYLAGRHRNATRAQDQKPSRINNNVKFYITDSGHLYFHNIDFLESLRSGGGEPPLDPDCLALVDSIFFSIWPPAASARRSRLARDFVGYLGTLVGTERIHELRVWPDPSAVNPSMRRLPASIPVTELEAAVGASGGHYPDGELRRYHAGLNFLAHKHFVILSGLSGTGKTQLAIRYARAVHGLNAPGTEDPFLIVCAVRPEWTDPSALTGYFDVLSNRYVVPSFLEAVLLATAHPDSPVFVVLDEMNLARVEYYLSDVLSAIETEEPLRLHSNAVPLEGSTGVSIQAEMHLPRNLFITGTINIDETTNPISSKVLDRAIVIDMSNVDLLGFLAVLEKREPKLAKAREACEPLLRTTHALMTTHGLGFGYRCVEEFIRYYAFADQHMGGARLSTMDDLMVQKVLIKLRGAEKQRALLSGLGKALAGMPRAQEYIAQLTSDLDEFGSFQATR
jgi:5-methylcytosine-specific restriction protein B